MTERENNLKILLISAVIIKYHYMLELRINIQLTPIRFQLISKIKHLGIKGHSKSIVPESRINIIQNLGKIIRYNEKDIYF